MQAIHEDEQLQEEEEEVTVPCPSLLVNLPSSAAALVWAALEDERGAREVLLRKTSKQVSRAWAKHITFTKVLVPPDIDVRAGFEKMPATALTRVCGASLSMRTLHLRRKFFTLQLATPKRPSGEGGPTCQETVQAMLRRLAQAQPGSVAASEAGAQEEGGPAAPQPEGAGQEPGGSEDKPQQEQQQEQEQEALELHSVTNLHLQGFTFLGPDVPQCAAGLCRSLASLQLSQCELGFDFFAPLAQLPALRALTLLHVGLVDVPACASLAALTALTSLTLDRVLLPAAWNSTSAAAAAASADLAPQGPVPAVGDDGPSTVDGLQQSLQGLRLAPAGPPHLVVPGLAGMPQLRHLALHLHPRAPHGLDCAQLVAQLSPLPQLASLKAWGLSPQRELDGGTATRLAGACPALARLTLDRNVVVTGVRELLALRALTSLCARSLEPGPDAESGQCSLVGKSCSWQHLSLGAFCPSLTALAALPLHSLSAPFHLGELDLGGHPAAAQGDMEGVALAVRHALGNCVQHCSTLTFTAGKLELVGTSTWGAPPLADAWPALLALDLLEEHWKRREQQQQEQHEQQEQEQAGMGRAAAVDDVGGDEGGVVRQSSPGPSLGQAVSHIKLVGLRVGQQEVAALGSALGPRLAALTCSGCTLTPGALQHMVTLLPRLARLGFGRKCSTAGGLSALMHVLCGGLLQGAARRAQLQASEGKLIVCLTRPVAGRAANDSELVATEAEIHECRHKLGEFGLEQLVELELGSIA